MLRRRDSGESDRRLTIFTPEEGKLEVVAKGARRAASRLAGSSEPLVAAVLQLAPGRKSSFIVQAQPQSSFPGLRSDYGRLTAALALAELYEAVLPWRQPEPEAYELLLRSLRRLESHSKPEVAFVWAQLALLSQTGFLPQFESCVQTGVPVAEAEPFISPTAGGYVVAEHAAYLHDRLRTRAEVLYGLARTAQLDEPPASLKYAHECSAVLYACWRHVADRPLPGLDTYINESRDLGSPSA